jgi:predicted transport protein
MWKIERGVRLRLFTLCEGSAVEVVPQALEFERDLQGLVEAHMPALLGVRFLASEYSTGPVHGGRIDSLGIDENGAPVVVEYKRGRDPGVITQGLFYLAWLTDHRAEFEALVRDRLGVPAASQVLWSAPRLICVAEDFTRYDQHAVGEIRRCIDLVRYRFFGAGLLGLEPVVTATARDRSPGSGSGRAGRMPKKQPADDAIGELRDALDDVLVSLGEDVRRIERKQYRPYRRLRNIACVGRGQRSEVLVYLRADPKKADLISGFTRDVTGLGHHGTGDLEVRLRTEKDLERAGDLLRLSYTAA